MGGEKLAGISIVGRLSFLGISLVMACQQGPTSSQVSTVVPEVSEQTGDREEDGSQGEVELAKESIYLDEIHLSSTPDSHSDYSISGTQCRRLDEAWRCRSYQAYHSFDREALEGGWATLSDPDEWRGWFMEASVQEALGLDVPMPTPGTAIPRRGTRRVIDLAWSAGRASYDLEDAPEAIIELHTRLMLSMPQMDRIEPRYELPRDRPARVGLRELAWLDESHALKLARCEHNDVLLEWFEDGRVVDRKKLGKEDRGTVWQVDGFRLQVDFMYCGRQNYVSLTVQED